MGSRQKGVLYSRLEFPNVRVNACGTSLLRPVGAEGTCIKEGGNLVRGMK